MLEQLDDVRMLPPATAEQRRTTRIRGRRLRRRRRATKVVVPLMVVLGSMVWAWPSSPSYRGDEQVPVTSAVPYSSTLPMTAAVPAVNPALFRCEDPIGDSIGEPDLNGVGLDRVWLPYISWDFERSQLPAAGFIQATFLATSADGATSRQLVVQIRDGIVVGQFVRDPATGSREEVAYDERVAGWTADGQPPWVVTQDTHDIEAFFPGAAVSPVGDGYAWKASIEVDGVVVDSCTVR